MHPAVFLDLDNTIVQDTGGSADPDAVVLIKGAAPAIASLRGLGYRIVVVANHEGVARGKFTEDDVQALHARIAEMVNKTANGAVIDAFYYCPYHPKGALKKYKKDHPSRKPRPGMLTQAAEEMSLDLASSWMIGDMLADVRAGHAAGARTIMLRPDADKLKPIDLSQLDGITSDPPDIERAPGPDFYAIGLIDAARLIAQQPRVEQHEVKAPVPGRKWDAEKIAKLQVPRPDPKPGDKPVPAQPSGKAFRPWGAPSPDEDATPIVAKPFRKRTAAPLEQSAAPDAVTAVQEAPAPVPPAAQSPPTPAPAAAPAARPEPQDIPANIRQAIEQKKQAAGQGKQSEAGDSKTLRLILHELRAQRGSSQEFSFLTIVAVAMQLVAIVCLLGGLFMGGDSDGLFLRWMGVGLMAQFIAITTLLYGR